MLGTWRDIALALLNKNIITQNIFDQILQRYYFGLCIANNDMRPWNLSFFISGETIEELAPVYDMLPMAFAPINEELVQYRFNRPVLLPNEESKWRTIIPIAINFWAKVLENKKFSKEIKEAARVWKGHLEKI